MPAHGGHYDNPAAGLSTCLQHHARESRRERVRDLAKSRAFYVDTLGFVVSDDDRNTLYLRGLEEGCHHSLVLKSGTEPECERVGLRVLTEEDLDLAEAHFRKCGLPTLVDAPFQNRTLHTTDVVGTPLELCATMQTKPRRIMHFETFHGACPQRIDHVQVLTPAVRAACEFYMAMGFRLSEYIVPDGGNELRAVFLQRKGNPHDIVFVNNAGPRLHHVAFTIPEVHHMMYVCDLLGRNGFGASVEWGPGRHFGPGAMHALSICAIPTATVSSCSPTITRPSTSRTSRSAGRCRTSTPAGGARNRRPVGERREASLPVRLSASRRIICRSGHLSSLAEIKSNRRPTAEATSWGGLVRQLGLDGSQ
jgi:catechol 2,3-dioxygenase